MSLFFHRTFNQFLVKMRPSSGAFFISIYLLFAIKFTKVTDIFRQTQRLVLG